MIKKRLLYGLLIFFCKIHTMELVQKVEQLADSPEAKNVENTVINFVTSPTGQNIIKEVEQEQQEYQEKQAMQKEQDKLEQLRLEQARLEQLRQQMQEQEKEQERLERLRLRQEEINKQWIPWVTNQFIVPLRQTIGNFFNNITSTLTSWWSRLTGR